MMHPPNLAFIAKPVLPDPHIAIVYRRKDGSMFYGSTWLEALGVKAMRSPKGAAYLVRIRMKPEALA